MHTEQEFSKGKALCVAMFRWLQTLKGEVNHEERCSIIYAIPHTHCIKVQHRHVRTKGSTEKYSVLSFAKPKTCCQKGYNPCPQASIKSSNFQHSKESNLNAKIFAAMHYLLLWPSKDNPNNDAGWECLLCAHFKPAFTPQGSLKQDSLIICFTHPFMMHTARICIMQTRLVCQCHMQCCAAGLAHHSHCIVMSQLLHQSHNCECG